MATIKSNTKKLLQTLKLVQAAVQSRSKKAIATTCEITVTDGKATFAVPSAVFSLECVTQGTCKATFPFLHFTQIIKDSKAAETEIIVSEGSLKINTVTISAKTTFFENDRILRTIQLPINYTDANLLCLIKESYTWEELEFNKRTSRIYQAEENLKDNMMEAYRKRN